MLKLLTSNGCATIVPTPAHAHLANSAALSLMNASLATLRHIMQARDCVAWAPCARACKLLPCTVGAHLAIATPTMLSKMTPSHAMNHCSARVSAAGCKCAVGGNTLAQVSHAHCSTLLQHRAQVYLTTARAGLFAAAPCSTPLVPFFAQVLHHQGPGIAFI